MVTGLYSEAVLNLSFIQAVRQAGRKREGEKIKTFNQCFIMADTETSRSDVHIADHIQNHVVCWSIAMRVKGKNIFCLHGRKPSEFCQFVSDIHQKMRGNTTIIYFHNLTYDWQFLRKFCFKAWGFPVNQLNTKSHYPINIEFENGIIFRDSLILAQVSLQKWGDQMQVEHGKALDCWNYEKIRNQDTELSDEEILYIQDDVLCGVECLDALSQNLHKKPHTMPWTATGIVREMTQKLGRAYHAHDIFLAQAFEFSDYLTAEQTYHGAFTHANRHIVGDVVEGLIQCYDFASSYPYVMVSEKFPCEKFTKVQDCSISDILKYSDDWSFMFKFVAIGIRLKNPHHPMPFLQSSKCLKKINPVYDNGRILNADAVSIYLTEQDLAILNEQYYFERSICTDVQMAQKDYLPRWFTDLVFDLYKKKCTLKNGDPTEYALSKSRVNSLYGMCCQKLLKLQIDEVYQENEYRVNEEQNPVEVYDKTIHQHKMVLSYQTGIWVTAYACRNLFELGKCFSGEDSIWCYSDTDSCYGVNIDQGLLKQYNDKALEKLRANNYDLIEYDGKTFQLGEATLDGEYTEFKTLGAKRYACREKKSGKLKITIAGVPKAGVKELEDDINNFRKGMVFHGTVTGKKTHFYIYKNDIEIDSHGNEVGDSIDLEPCDYLLDDIFSVDAIFHDEIGVPIYDIL